MQGLIPEMTLQESIVFCDYLQPGEEAAAAVERISWALPCAQSDPSLVSLAAFTSNLAALHVKSHAGCCQDRRSLTRLSKRVDK